jgi:hypothetical protein
LVRRTINHTSRQVVNALFEPPASQIEGLKILLLSAVGASLAAAVSIPVANAKVLAVIGQESDTDQVTATVAGSVTTISSSTLVDITAIDAPISVPITATLDFTATSVGSAVTVGGNIVQAYTGSFSITGRQQLP